MSGNNIDRIVSVIGSTAAATAIIGLTLGAASCSTRGRPRTACDRKHVCDEGYVCNRGGECVEFILPDCDEGPSYCPSKAEGKACAPDESYMPCSDTTTDMVCEGGCHVCEGGVWSDCRIDICFTGLVRSCSSCTNDCEEQIKNAEPMCQLNANSSGYVCTMTGDCLNGAVDLNQDPSDGCECLPSGSEICDGLDNDCNGEIDEGEGIAGCQAHYPDEDGDGHGKGTNADKLCFCIGHASEGYVFSNDDCDDTDPTTYPNAPQLCDGDENDCNAWVTGVEPEPPDDERDLDGNLYVCCKNWEDTQGNDPEILGGGDYCAP